MQYQGTNSTSEESALVKGSFSSISDTYSHIYVFWQKKPNRPRQRHAIQHRKYSAEIWKQSPLGHLDLNLDFCLVHSGMAESDFIKLAYCS